ncbi:MFS transporter [Chloroflexota bacterium]
MYIAVFLCCLAIGQGFGVYMPVHTTAANWFIKKRSRAMGILQTGTGAGGILVPLFAWIIAQYGWRMGAIVAGATLLSTALPLATLFRHRPEQYGYLPDGELAKTPGAPVTTSPIEMTEKLPLVEIDFSLKEAIKTRAFWALVIAFGMSQAVSSSVVLHSIPHLTDVGIPTVMAATAAGAIGMTSILGRISFGWLGDRVSKRHFLAIAFALEVVGILIFSNIHSPWHIIPFLLVYCLGYGGVQPLLLSILADFFGRKHYGTIFGSQQFFRAFIQVPLPVLTGWIFDVTGSYRIAFMLFIILLVIAIGLMLITKPPTKVS